MFIKNKITSGHLCVGVIAGTAVDTRFGIEFLQARDVKGVGFAISASPQAQTNLQALQQFELKTQVLEAISSLKKEGANCTMIYCNSLSGAVDLDRINNESELPVITPIDVYAELTEQYRNFGLLAANCQSCSNIEKNILMKNPTAKVIGIGNLQIVEDIEAGLSPEMIIKLHALPELIRALVKSGVQVLIMGCTHFDYFFDTLNNETHDIQLFQPSERMLEILKRKVLP